MSESSGLMDIQRVFVPKSLAEAAHEHFRRVGKDGVEGMALWVGHREGREVQVVETVIPAQRGIRSPDGVGVTVDGDELFRLNVHLHEHRLGLVAQLHSHPGDAYHSDTDDAFPIATTAGAFSIVVPDYASRPFSLKRCAIYRLFPQQGWVELSTVEALTIINIVNDD